MSSARYLVELPTEILQRVLVWTLFIDAQAEVPLLLTSHFLKGHTESAANNSARKYAIEQYGKAATEVFAPVPYQNLLHDWLPRLEQAMERIDEVLDGIRAGFDVDAALVGELSPAASASAPVVNVSTSISIIRVGLYFIEAVHFQRQLGSDDIRKLLNWSLPHELLILRQVSVVVANVYSRCIWRELSASDGTRKSACMDTLRHNRSLMVRAVEFEMLLRGASVLFDVIRPSVPDPSKHDYPSHSEYLAAKEEVGKKNLRRKKARSKAVEQFIGTVAMLQMYGHFPPGPLQDKEKTDMISNSIAANYGGVPVLPTKKEDILTLMVLLADEVKGKSEEELLTEMKATMES